MKTLRPGPPGMADKEDMQHARPASTEALEARFAAQARRIRELEQQLAERNRLLHDASHRMSDEMARLDVTQAALFQAGKVESIGHMVAGLSHDLRNVIGMMTSSFQIIGRKSDIDVVQHWVKNGQLAGKQATALIENMLAFIRPGEVRLESFAPADWLAEHADLLKHAVGPGITCRLAHPDEAWLVQVDPHRMGAAVINLAINARDAMPQGGNLTVDISHVRPEESRPPGLPEGELVRISVNDDGSGMPPEVLARALEPLFTTKPVGKGTGLGLPMVQAFAQSFAGQVQIESTQGVGTRVSIWLPRCTGDRAPETLPGEAAPISAATALAPETALLPTVAPGQTLLYIDDDDLSRLAMSAALRRAGYAVLEANNTEMALALGFSRHRFTAAIISLAAGQASPGGLLQALRQRHRNLPALIIAPRRPEGVPEAVPVLPKPVNLPQLLSLLPVLVSAEKDRTLADDTYLDRLLVRMHAPALVEALIAWRSVRGEAFFPEYTWVRECLRPMAAWSFVAEPVMVGGIQTFRFIEVGSALEEQLGRQLAGKFLEADDSEESVALSAAYRRAARNGLPSYEYLKYTLGHEQPGVFERLILPASQSGDTFSHLLGVAMFSNV